MLARLITAPFRLVRAYREELLVVAIGLLYQAGTNGTLARVAGHGHERRHDEVTVRIAEAPRAMVVVTHSVAVAPAARVASVESGSAQAASVAASRRAAQRESLRQARSREARVREQAVRDLVREARRAREAALAASVTDAAGAAHLALGRYEMVLPDIEAEIRAAGALGDAARPAIDEARVRAAIARALAAEQAVARGRIQGT